MYRGLLLMGILIDHLVCVATQDAEGLFPCILGHEAAGYV